jgi:hypothetical protein
MNTQNAFTIGQCYTRDQIRAQLGGSAIDFLPRACGVVVCGCFTTECNPDAPDVVIPGTGPVIEESAEIFCSQDFPVPIFLKRRPGAWEYVGDYQVESFKTDQQTIEKYHKWSITPLSEITRVMFLKRI